MYQEFCLKKEKDQQGQITGYRWDLKSAKGIVCIIHGIGEYAGRYDRLAGKLQEAGYAAFSMDLRGHGKSAGKRGHCAPREKIRRDIDELISAAEGAYPERPLILYGHSMGGNIVLDYRKRGGGSHKPAVYVVSAPWVQLVRQIPAYQYAAVKLLSKIIPSFTIGSGVSAKELGNPKTVGDYERDPLTHKKISLLCALESFEIGSALAEGHLADNGGAEGIPMLLMHGTEDKICSIKGSEKIAALETCDYIPWQGLYHEIHNGGSESSGDEVIETMIRWIQGHLA
ncbi:MAG: alpha/beta hydrolase [Firmicutes bacterium]|nr:alpha/beta hydrolase [Bacillota bacterium]